MSLERLTQIQEERNDVMYAMITHMERCNILLKKIAEFIPPRYLEEFGECLADQGKDMMAFGDLTVEETKVMIDYVNDKAD